jgi:APA family basic amino acid/polyamine antiporter
VGYPVLPALYIALASAVSIVLLIADKTRAQALIGLALVCLGVPIYFLWRSL